MKTICQIAHLDVIINHEMRVVHKPTMNLKQGEIVPHTGIVLSVSVMYTKDNGIVERMFLSADDIKGIHEEVLKIESKKDDIPYQSPDRW